MLRLNQAVQNARRLHGAAYARQIISAAGIAVIGVCIYKNCRQTRVLAGNLGAHFRVFALADIGFDVGLHNQRLPGCEALA